MRHIDLVSQTADHIAAQTWARTTGLPADQFKSAADFDRIVLVDQATEMLLDALPLIGALIAEHLPAEHRETITRLTDPDDEDEFEGVDHGQAHAA